MDTDTITEDTTTYQTQSEPRQLRRPWHGRMLTGVAGGLADYLGVDPTLVRIGFAVLTLFGGTGIFLYVAGLVLIPDEGSDQSIASSVLHSIQSR